MYTNIISIFNMKNNLEIIRKILKQMLYIFQVNISIFSIHFCLVIILYT